jgi:hypothetical protein
MRSRLQHATLRYATTTSEHYQIRCLAFRDARTLYLGVFDSGTHYLDLLRISGNATRRSHERTIALYPFRLSFQQGRLVVFGGQSWIVYSRAGSWSRDSLCEDMPREVCLGPDSVIRLSRADVVLAQSLHGEVQFRIPFVRQSHPFRAAMLTIADELWIIEWSGLGHVHHSRDGTFLRHVQLELGDPTKACISEAVAGLGVLCVPVVLAEKRAHTFACFTRDGKRVANLPVEVSCDTLWRLVGCEDRIAVLDHDAQALHLFSFERCCAKWRAFDSGPVASDMTRSSKKWRPTLTR